MASRIMLVGSQEFLETEVTSDVDLLTQSVEISLDRGISYKTANWEDDPSTEIQVQVGVTDRNTPIYEKRYVRKTLMLFGPANPLPTEGQYPVWVRLYDSQEILVLPAGALEVKA